MVEDGKNKRPFKGDSCICFPETYCVVDIETTGKDPRWDHIIEIGAIQYADGYEIKRYQTLVQPPLNSRGCFIDEFIENLTGITNEALSEAPQIDQVIGKFEEFVGDSIIIGWNISGFDINFLYDAYMHYLNRPMTNNFVDALRIARRLLKDMDSHKLQFVAARYNILNNESHRALADVETEHECFLHLKEDALAQYPNEEAFGNTFSNRSSRFSAQKAASDSLLVDPSKVDEENPFYKQKCVSTGKLEKMTRKEFEENINALKGEFQTGLTKDTNYLILADNIARQAAEGGKKTTKQTKAEDYQRKGLPIEILSEQIFYDLIEDYCY